MTETQTQKDLEQKVAELEQTIKILKDDLIHDSLTGLKTRAFFDSEAKIFFDAVVNRDKGTRKEWFGIKNISFIFFDIDHFKEINDKYGHLAGDGVLKTVARTIEEGIRKGDIAARWGGEEIVVALVGSSEDNARSRAEAIRKSVERLSFNSVPQMNVTVSAGVASAVPEISFEEVIKRSDRAMYSAKQSGRNKVVAWSEISK
jgi:diguanylate cyclase (GGDEF)-like protein